MKPNYRDAGVLICIFVALTLVWWQILSGAVIAGYRINTLSGFFLFFVLVIALGMMWNSYLNPFIYLLPLVVYYTPGVFILFADGGRFLYWSGWVLFLSLLFFWFGWRLFLKKEAMRESCIFSSPPISKQRLLFFALASVIGLFLVNVAALYGGVGGKGIAFLGKDVLGMMVFGSLLAVAVRSPVWFHFVFILHIVFSLFINFQSQDVSRFGILVLVIYYLFAVILMLRSDIRPFSLKSLFALVFVFAFFIFFVGIDSFAELGGDALILPNLVSVVEYIDSAGWRSMKPGMPIFNAGPLLLPDFIWLLGDKPKAFNSSAWFLENILQIDPIKYPWGVGVSGVGAAYIYGGLAGVATLFFLVGCFMSFMVSRLNNSFLFGVYLFFLFKLPFALYRMDETFLFGVAAISVPFILFIFSRSSPVRGLAHV